MPFQNFPYTSLNDINLDWLLKTVKDDHDTLTGLNIQQLVDDTIQELIDDGTLGDLINNTLLANINSDITALQTTVGQHTSRINALELWQFRVDDYVIEEGEDTGWRYIKWNSGEVELWCQVNVTPVNDDVHGNLYYSQEISIPLPFKVSRAVLSGSAGRLNLISNPTAVYEDQAVKFRLQAGSSISETTTTLNLYVRGELI